MIENIYQIRIHSRGGQGAKTAGTIIAEAFIAQGNFAQAFAEYGPERSGAPMKVFVRLSDKEIRLHGDVENPDMVVVLDASLLDSVNVSEGMVENGILLVNTIKSPEEIAKKISNKNCRIYPIDAGGIAKEILGKNLPNTVIMGAVAKLLPSISRKKLSTKISEKFHNKLSEEMTEKNIKAMETGYKIINQ